MQYELTVRKGDTILEIGDDFDYDETDNVDKDVEWKVLGASDNGELLIVSVGGIVSEYRLGYEPSMTDADAKLKESQNDWLNGVTQLNSLCAPYGEGKDATGSRSITIEDVNKITGYKIKEYGKDQIYEYGNKVTYSYNGTTTPSYIGSNGVQDTLTIGHPNGFHYYNGTDFIKDDLSKEKGKITTITSNYCGYNINDIELDHSNKAHTLVFGTGYNYESYWLANAFVGTQMQLLDYGFLVLLPSAIHYDDLWLSIGATETHTRSVRAVVSLSPNIKTTGSSETGWSY